MSALSAVLPSECALKIMSVPFLLAPILASKFNSESNPIWKIFLAYLP